MNILKGVLILLVIIVILIIVRFIAEVVECNWGKSGEPITMDDWIEADYRETQKKN